jgi:hypothetical protein
LSFLTNYVWTLGLLLPLLCCNLNLFVSDNDTNKYISTMYYKNLQVCHYQLLVFMLAKRMHCTQGGRKNRWSPNAHLNSTCSCSCRWDKMSMNCSLQHVYCSFPRLYMSMESYGGMILTWKKWTQRKTCSNATLSTTKPTWTGLSANLNLQGERLATNLMSHGKAC